jgi:hypothetical protein
MVIFAGKFVKLGITVLFTVTDCTLDWEFPQESVVVQVRSITVRHPVFTMISSKLVRKAPLQLSLTVGVPVTEAFDPATQLPE